MCKTVEGRSGTGSWQGHANAASNYQPRPPEVILAECLKEDLGVDINPQALRLFLRWHWGKVAKLAHKIHGAAS